jgi:acetyl esterase/lipase
LTGIFLFSDVKAINITIPQDVNVYCNIPYSWADANTPLLLNLYVPASKKPLPLIIYIHGGGWSAGSKEYVLPQDFHFLEKGYAIASVEYRFSNKAIFPAQIKDCKAAVRFLRSNAKKYNLDANHFGAWGDSAGGHLAALLGMTSNSRAFGEKDQKVSDSVQAVCDWFGPTDLTRFAPDPNSKQTQAVYDVMSKLIGGPISEKMSVAKSASPVTYINPQCPPFLIIHGTNDNLVPLAQSQLLYDGLKKAGVPVELKIIPDSGHGDTKAFADPNLIALESAFFDKYLKKN